MHVRKLSMGLKDIQKCEDALKGKPGLDPDVLAYPATTILVAEDGTNTAYMPVQKVFMMETCGYDESIPDLALASAMKQFVSILVWESRNAGQGELYFLGNNEETNTFALNNGFEEVKWRVFRMKTLQEATPLQGTTENKGPHNEGLHKD